MSIIYIIPPVAVPLPPCTQITTKQYGCECDKSNLSDQRYLNLKNILPPQCEYRLCSFMEEGDGFSAVLRLRSRTADESKAWLKLFQEVSKTTMRVDKTYPNSGRKNVYKIDLRCHHKTRTKAERSSSKNTDCSAKMTIIVRRTEQKNPRSKDSHMPDFPMIVTIKYTHNHPINSAKALRHRDVSEGVRQKFLLLFKAGHSPLSALEMHKFDLQLEHRDEFVQNIDDRAMIPDLQWCSRLYYILQKQGCRGDKRSVINDLQSVILKLNSGRENPIIKMNLTEDYQLVIAICTPLMQRVVQDVKESGEIIFVDSGNIKRHKLRIHLLLTNSCAGGLPIGCLVTSSHSEKSIQCALELYCEMLPFGAFCGRQQRGPHVFITGDSDSERSALHSVFPESVLFLCEFHLLQATWRWVWDKKNNVPLQHKQVLFGAIKEMVYLNSSELLEASYQKSLNDSQISVYPDFVKYLNHVYDKKELWSACYREDLKILGIHTDNFGEIAARVLKDKIIMRAKSFNILQLVDFVVHRLGSFYERRMLDLVDNRLDYLKNSKYMPVPSDIQLSEVCRLSCSEFTVPSESKKVEESYRVNMEVGMCTCTVGMSGAPCKHQAAVARKFNISSTSFIPVLSSDVRQVLYNLATGKTDSEKQLHKSLQHDIDRNISPPDTISSSESNQHSFQGNFSIIKECATLQNNNQRVLVDREAKNIIKGNYEYEQNSEVKKTDILKPCVYQLDSEDRQDSEVTKIKRGLECYFSHLSAKLESDPKTYIPAVRSFLKNTQKLKSDSTMVSALNSFGKDMEISQTFVGNQGSKLVGSKKRIQVQPSTNAKRKKGLLKDIKSEANHGATEQSNSLEHN